MRISILTLFPDTVTAVINHSILKRAQEKSRVYFTVIDMRRFSTDAYKSVDDHPYGGGVGMLLRVDVVDAAISFSKSCVPTGGKTTTILLDPQGTPYNQATAATLAKYDHLILVAGHYEGVDERVRSLVDMELSIGDYVLTGGELPALVVTDSVTRLVPGVLSKAQATEHETFSHNLLEYPQYTRPQEYKGMKVPDVLRSGDHADIARWREVEAQKKTLARRPDLLRSYKTLKTLNKTLKTHKSQNPKLPKTPNPTKPKKPKA